MKGHLACGVRHVVGNIGAFAALENGGSVVDVGTPLKEEAAPPVSRGS